MLYLYVCTYIDLFIVEMFIVLNKSFRFVAKLFKSRTCILVIVRNYTGAVT